MSIIVAILSIAGLATGGWFLYIFLINVLENNCGEVKFRKEKIKQLKELQNNINIKIEQELSHLPEYSKKRINKI